VIQLLKKIFQLLNLKQFQGKKNEKDKKQLSKDQPGLEKGSPDIRDHIAPSLAKELAPKELTGFNEKAGDYIVEVGATSELARFFRSFTATMKTSTTYAGMYNQLYQGEFGSGNLDTAVHLRPADENTALRDLARMISGLESDYNMTQNSTQKSKIRDSILDLREQERRLRRSIERMFFVSTQTIVSATTLDELKKFSNSMIKRFAGQGVILRPNDKKQLQALTCMTPFDQEKVFEHSFRNMESSCVADLFPFGQGGISHTDGVILGRDNYKKLVYLDCWHPKLPNAHLVIFGRAGTGKSYTVKILTLRSAFWGIRTGIIDPDPKSEYENLVVALNGSYIKLNSNSDKRINFLDINYAEDNNGRITVELEESINASQAVVFKMIESIEPSLLDGYIKMAIREKLRNLYSKLDITSDPNSLFDTTKNTNSFVLGGRRLKQMPSLSDLYDEMSKDVKLARVADALKYFTQKSGDSTMSIFDCVSNVNIKKDICFAFSVGNLEKAIMKPLGSFIATKWTRENFALQDRFQKKRVIVDEAQELMKTPEMADWTEDSFRQGRKYNVSMCAATQGFEVFMRVPQGLGVLKNATMKLILRQESLDIDAVQGQFNLSEGEANFVLSTPKGTGILKVDNESTILNVLSTKEEDELFTTDPNQLRMLAQKYKKTS
jgi:type IV secretory pathway VirB4 component